jgi:hypothetical protein
MDFLNDSDLNTEARVETPTGSVLIPAHLRGYADSVRVETVPSAQGNELLVMFRAEAGYTGAALRVTDLLAVLAEHYPEMLATALSPSPPVADEDEGLSPGYGWRR